MVNMPITKKEFLSLILVLIVLSFSNSFVNLSTFLLSLIMFSIIIIFYIGAKKLTAYYYESEEETKIWTFQRYGLREKSYFKTPIPIGLILPVLLSLITLGYVNWFAVTESDVRPLPTRVVKRHDYYSFSEMTEFHLGLISASGIISCLFLSVLAYIFNIPELARLSIYFACFNILPLGKLDGTRIFFGHRVLWAAIVAVCMTFLLYALILV